MGAGLTSDARIEIQRVDRVGDRDAAAIAALVERAAAHERHPPLGEDKFLRLRHGDPDTFGLVVRDGDRLAAYAHATRFAAHGAMPERLAAELAVDPPRRGRGIGRRLFAAVVDAARSAGVERVDLWGHRAEAPCAALAQAFGMRATRALWQLSLDVDNVPHELRSEPLPAGVAMRSFRPRRDEDTVVKLVRRAFPDHPENATWTRGDLDERTTQPWFDPSAVLLAESESGQLLGVHWMKLAGGDAAAGEVYMLGVAPEMQGHGLGRALLLAGLAEMRRRGIGRAFLYVEADNDAALHLYREAGFRREHLDTCYSLDLSLSDGTRGVSG
ncbi:MAG: mycothiol synthase [Candidatus Limnocylindria bacterium]